MGKIGFNGQPDFVRYTILVLIMVFFVILYVWQNIEVMQLKMDYDRSVRYKKELVIRRDRLLYDIERYKRLSLIEEFAERHKLKRITPENAVRLTRKEDDNGEN